MEQQLADDPVLTRIDEEDVRLVTGFADVFAALVTCIGLIALAAVAAPLGSMAGFAVAAAAWGLSIPLVRTRNFAACAILLAAAIGLGSVTGLWFLYGAAGLPVAFVLWRYWRSFNVPVAAALALAIPTVTLLNIATAPRHFAAYSSGWWQLLLSGLILFGFAMHFDLGDRLRRTRRADIAFWLHLMAAPLAVHGMFGLLGIDAFGGREQFAPGPVLAVVGALALIALVIDRRPLLVSSLIYFAAAIAQLARSLGVVEGQVVVTLVLGGFVLVLATFWSGLRGQLLRLLPTHLADRVPPAGGKWSPPAAQARDTPGEDEPVRLVSSFNDVFVVMGVQAVWFGAWLAGGLTAWNRITAARENLFGRNPFLAMATRDNPQFSIMGSQAVESAIHFAEVVWSSAWLFVLPPLLFAWALAEFFVRRRRMALPALILAGDFALPAFLVGVLVAVRLVPGTLVALAQSSVLMEVDRHAAANWPALLLVTSAVAVALNLAFWHRHRVPVAFAHAAAALLPLLFLDVAIAGSGRAWSDAFTWPALRVHMLAGGVLAFAGAMAWDWSDRTRQTQHADTAFWLHLLASALALPAIFGIAGEALGPYAGALVAYVALIVLAVVIDRRAVLVVGLAWLLPAIFAHGKTASANLVALAIAVGLMALILKWHALRARIPGLVATTGSGER